MTLLEIKQISIKNYLVSIGCNIKIDRGYYGMYLSPYRKETNPSLKVDYNKNLFIDYSNNEGGSIIDLVMKVENCDFQEAVSKLKNNSTNSFSFHCQEYSSNRSPLIKKVKDLENKALLDYLLKRKVDLSLAKQYCKEIYYTVNNKSYFAIAFENILHGYEVRSKYFKGTIGKKGITYLQNETKILYVFEGFIDFLSYIGNHKNKEGSFIILNSLSFVQNAVQYFDKYEKVNLFLDNDDMGRLHTIKLLESYPNTYDFSNSYINYKDYNEFIMYNR